MGHGFLITTAPASSTGARGLRVRSPLIARRPPSSWLPGLGRFGLPPRSATDDDLLSGRAWTDLLEALAGAGAVLTSDRAPASAVDRAAGYRHLLVLLALAIDEALRPSDPYDPFFTPANVDNILKWGMDCPDAAYTGAVGPPRRHLPHHRATARRSAISASRSCRASPTPATSWPTTSTSAPTAASRSSSRPTPSRATGWP